MLNVDETLILTKPYNNSRDFLFKGFLYSLIVLIFLDILRNQISEINLLQLNPGFYLILFFFSFIFLIIFSDFFFLFAKRIENRKEFGTKLNTRADLLVKLKLTSIFFFIAFFILLNLVLPLSFDSFNSYGEKTLENIWSFDEVIGLEIILLLIFFFFSQLPIITLYFFSTEKDINFFPEFWKFFSFLIFFLAGFLTPTIDGYTQLSFSLSLISFYFLVIQKIEKRLSVKISGIFSIN